MPNDTPDAAATTTNHILSSLSPKDLERLMPDIEPVELSLAKKIFYPGEEIDHIYFPSNAIISVVAYTPAGQSAEVGVIGREGLAGYDVLLGGVSTPFEHIVQIPNGGWRVKTDIIKREFNAGGALHHSILNFTRQMMLQIGRTALCNRLHTAEERLARWLLMCRDRSDHDVLELTQEFLAKMLGSDRVTVTQAAGKLHDNGLIEYRRGHLVITDRGRLRDFSCDCYDAPETETAL